MQFDQLKRREFITLLDGVADTDRHVLAREVAAKDDWLDGCYDRLPSFKRAKSAFAAWPEIKRMNRSIAGVKLEGRTLCKPLVK